MLPLPIYPALSHGSGPQCQALCVVALKHLFLSRFATGTSHRSPRVKPPLLPLGSSSQALGRRSQNRTLVVVPCAMPPTDTKHASSAREIFGNYGKCRECAT
eukprot:scaffold4611_cov253-Pinguiococcus_pyrenoidosus.AAC.4